MVCTFGASMVVVIGSLHGPLHDLSERYLFSAHMVQHLLLAQLFPPLFVLGVPAWARFSDDARRLAARHRAEQESAGLEGKAVVAVADDRCVLRLREPQKRPVSAPAAAGHADPRR